MERRNRRGMILAVDMGNTNIVIGCVDENKVHFEERMATDHSKTEIEYAVLFKTVLEIHNINACDIAGAIISSVVPPLVKVVSQAMYKITGIKPLIVGPGVKSGLNIMMDQPRQMGSDLIVDSVAAIKEYGAPLIVIDMGTATTFSVIDENKNYIGGAIMPGIKVSIESLVAKTAMLQRISFEAPKHVIGKNTNDCMQSGTIYGNAASIDGMVSRMVTEMREHYKMTKEIKVVATGGLASVIVPNCEFDIIVDNELLLKGLKIIYDKNVE